MQPLPAPTDDREAREREVAARKWLASSSGGRALVVDREAGPKAPKAARTQEAYQDAATAAAATMTATTPTTSTPASAAIAEGARDPSAAAVDASSRPPVMMTTTSPTDKRILRSASRRGK